jgi:hypothetical protein
MAVPSFLSTTLVLVVLVVVLVVVVLVVVVVVFDTVPVAVVLWYIRHP